MYLEHKPISAGATVGPDAETAGLQRDVVKHDDDILGRDVEEGGQLLDGLTGQIHIGQRLEKIQFVALVGYLVVQTLELAFIHTATQLLSQDIQCAETTVVAGLCIFRPGIAQTNDKPILHNSIPTVKIV